MQPYAQEINCAKLNGFPFKTAPYQLSKGKKSDDSKVKTWYNDHDGRRGVVVFEEIQRMIVHAMYPGVSVCVVALEIERTKGSLLWQEETLLLLY